MAARSASGDRRAARPKGGTRHGAAGGGPAIRAGACLYRREHHLPALIGADPALVADPSEAAARVILGRIERALRAERHRARAGHWAYDRNRHIALTQARAAETERLAALARP